MMMTSEWVSVLDEVDELIEMIKQSELAQVLAEAQQAVYNDETLVAQIRAFQYTKEQYEDVQRFGKYHPDYQKIMKDIRTQKRALDLHDKVAQLRLAENDFQDLLDEMSLLIGQSVSQAVKVPVSNPLLNHANNGCGSGCGSGGSCSCAV
ncbi:regulator [Lysinibacillus alkalisoli]|uniref:Regulator n=1 Tax=Lysinibacillus alkalisoli TaxID=1911548 RepID=A0A917G3F5_9BACI|nr:YlbF family regulator [Lysinibacillus alkalisoli]GGG20861.1 regulator [Lysinibacillus alkalisoli]